MEDGRRRIPRTDLLLADPRLVAAAQQHGRAAVKNAVVAAQQEARDGRLAPERVGEEALRALAGEPRGGLRPVVNATGVIVHTNLGRAPLSARARRALSDAAGSTDVEYDLATGRRARRGRGALAALADAVPDAGGVHVVNNAAAALLLTVLALARGREVVVSRGELVEIGDGFRIPELLESAGARLREVGTTNRTHLRDYADALNPDTALVLKVHPSNYRVRGFTAEVGIRDLAGLGVPVVADLGSGLLRAHPLLPDEPDVASALRAGAGLVIASGDKLLGGPQCGLVLGEPDIVERLRRHPAARAVRVDKLTLAALEATLRGPSTPVADALAVDPATLRRRAERLAEDLAAAGVATGVLDCTARVGGGGAPGVELPSVAVSLPEAYAAALRTGDPAVVGRLEGGRCLLDLRTVAAGEDAALAAAVLRLPRMP